MHLAEDRSGCPWRGGKFIGQACLGRDSSEGGEDEGTMCEINEVDFGG